MTKTVPAEQAILEQIEKENNELLEFEDYDVAMNCVHAIEALCDVLEKIELSEPQRVADELWRVSRNRPKGDPPHGEIAGGPALPYDHMTACANRIAERHS